MCNSKPQRLYDPYARQIVPNSVTPNDLYSAQQNSVQPEPTQIYRRPLIQQPTTDSSIISVSRAPDGSLVPKYQQQTNSKLVTTSPDSSDKQTSAAVEATVGTNNIGTTVSTTLENVSSTLNIVRGKRGK